MREKKNKIVLLPLQVFCGRYINQHMMFHNEESTHPLALSFTDLSVWCYVCEAYIDNMVMKFFTSRLNPPCEKTNNNNDINNHDNNINNNKINISNNNNKCYFFFRQILYPAKNAVHRSKFGSDLEWSYGDRTPNARLSNR